jgi:folate-binding protein YgfZ
MPRRRLDGPAAVHLTSDRVLRVEGSGSRRWLNSMLTADLRIPAPGAARYALLLGPAGGIVSDAWVVERGVAESERLALVLPALCAERAAGQLARLVFNEEIALSFDDAVRVVSLQGPCGRDLLEGPMATWDAYPCARLGRDGLDVWVTASQVDGVFARLSATAHQLGGGVIDLVEWSFARVALGVPQAGVDFDESTSPHEAGLEGRAVSFTKGCYPGQEVVARQHRRGGLTRQLVQLDIEGAEQLAEGSAVRGPGGEGVGRVTSVGAASDEATGILALAYVTPPFAKPGARVTVGDRVALVRGVLGRLGPPTPPGAPS